jgi:hypothetical protein
VEEVDQEDEERRIYPSTLENESDGKSDAEGTDTTKGIEKNYLEGSRSVRTASAALNFQIDIRLTFNTSSARTSKPISNLTSDSNSTASKTGIRTSTTAANTADPMQISATASPPPPTALRHSTPPCHASVRDDDNRFGTTSYTSRQCLQPASTKIEEASSCHYSIQNECHL